MNEQELDAFPVKVLRTKEERSAALIPMGCGTCGRWWDDAITTEFTPVPAGRCPFECFHQGDEQSSWRHPVVILDAIADIILEHWDSIAILDRTNSGFGINCACGKNFPPRNPGPEWVPKELTTDEWTEFTDEEKDEFIRGGWGGPNIRAKTAARDYYRHVAECILNFLKPVD